MDKPPDGGGDSEDDDHQSGGTPTPGDGDVAPREVNSGLSQSVQAPIADAASEAVQASRGLVERVREAGEVGGTEAEQVVGEQTAHDPDSALVTSVGEVVDSIHRDEQDRVIIDGEYEGIEVRHQIQASDEVVEEYLERELPYITAASAHVVDVYNDPTAIETAVANEDGIELGTESLRTNLRLNTQSRDAMGRGAASVGEPGMVIHWTPYSGSESATAGNGAVEAAIDTDGGPPGQRRIVDNVAVLAHEYSHCVGNDAEFDSFSGAMASQFRVKHNDDLPLEEWTDELGTYAFSLAGSDPDDLAGWKEGIAQEVAMVRQRAPDKFDDALRDGTLDMEYDDDTVADIVETLRAVDDDQPPATTTNVGTDSIRRVEEPLYHGTDASSAASLVSNGIIEERLQRRDHGLHGEGFYTTTVRSSAKGYADQSGAERNDEAAVVAVSLNDPRVLDVESYDTAKWMGVGDMLDDPPEWNDAVVDTYLDSVEEAAVWERIEGVERESLLERAENEVTPGHEDFDQQKWVNAVNDFAAEEGFDAVYWEDGEVVVHPDGDVDISSN